MHEKLFSKWASWQTRKKSLCNLEYPGVYAIAYSQRDLSGKKFSWIKNIIYIGMTNAVSGLDGRLDAFDMTISGKRLLHGGADRVRYKHQNYVKLAKNMYVAIAHFKCDAKSWKPSNLKKRGDVAKFEYLCFAEHVRKHGHPSEFNDQKNSPKYSKRLI